MSGENNAQNETQKTAAYSDEFRELIRKRLARDCTVVKDEQGEEHYVWKDTSDGLLPEIQLNKMRYRPYAWHFIQKTGYNPVYSMRKKCFYPGLCISHYVPVQNKRKRAEMEEVQFEDKTKEAEYIMAHLDESSRDFEIQRFLNLTKVNDADCHEWQGFLDVKGYGHHKIYGVTVRAHRAAWIL